MDENIRTNLMIILSEVAQERNTYEKNKEEMMLEGKNAIIA